MIEAASEDASSGLPRDLVGWYRPLVAATAQQMATQIQQDVGAFEGPETGRRHKLIALAASGAMNHFLEVVQGKPLAATRVDDLFRRMGYGQASAGEDLAPMRDALRVAVKLAWRELRLAASTHGLTSDALGVLGDVLFAYVEHLLEQIEIGFAAQARRQEQAPSAAGRRLVNAVLDGATPEERKPHESAVGWTVPDSLVVLTLRAGADTDAAPTDPADIPVALIGRIDGTEGVYIADTADGPAAAAELRKASPGSRVAISWPVEPGDAPDAHRWTQRALTLVAWGVLPDEPVVDCSEHRTQLWLHSEPALRRRLAQELLRPLLAETPNSREILSETLLAWLETRDSAPAIAARLHVHPQTVRYRWKRINELFGETLHQPEFVVQLTLVLKASVPLWVAGDQSDFERFRNEEAP